MIEIIGTPELGRVETDCSWMEETGQVSGSGIADARLKFPVEEGGARPWSHWTGGGV